MPQLPLLPVLSAAFLRGGSWRWGDQESVVRYMPRAKNESGGAKRRPGNPNGNPKYKTAEELQKKLDAYFAECDEKGEIYNEFSMGLYLGVALKTLKKWYTGDDCPYLQETIEMAYMKISAMTVQMAYQNPKAAMSIFTLKQDRFGGYQDKVEANADVNVNVHMGANMEASDFK